MRNWLPLQFSQFDQGSNLDLLKDGRQSRIVRLCFPAGGRIGDLVQALYRNTPQKQPDADFVQSVQHLQAPFPGPLFPVTRKASLVLCFISRFNFLKRDQGIHGTDKPAGSRGRLLNTVGTAGWVERRRKRRAAGALRRPGLLGARRGVTLTWSFDLHIPHFLNKLPYLSET